MKRNIKEKIDTFFEPYFNTENENDLNSTYSISDMLNGMKNKMRSEFMNEKKYNKKIKILINKLQQATNTKVILENRNSREYSDLSY